MQEVKVYGRSDDQILVEGESISEQFYYGSHRGPQDYLIFSDGTVLRVDYNDQGFWKIFRWYEGEANFRVEHQADKDNYSDEVILQGDLSWVFHAKDINKDNDVAMLQKQKVAEEA